MREPTSIRSLTRLAPLTRGTAERSYREAVTFNGSLTQLRRGPVCQRQSGAPLAATNVKTAGSGCKRRDAEALGIT